MQNVMRVNGVATAGVVVGDLMPENKDLVVEAVRMV